MDAEEVINRIIETCPLASKDQVLEKFKNQKKKTGGLISDETLLRLVAAEFGCELTNGAAAVPKLTFKHLVPGLTNTAVVGRVVAVFQPKSFSGARSGRFASMLLADSDGILRVMLWNDKAGLVESGKLKVGQIVRVLRGYTREDYGGRVELHVGEKSEIVDSPPDVNEEEFPSIDKFRTKISELGHSPRKGKVNVRGTVLKLFPASSFERQDSSEGKVMRLVLGDETSEVAVVAWNERVDELQGKLEFGVAMQIVNAKVKKAPGDGVEIHVDSNTFVEVLDSAEDYLKMAELKEGLKHVNVVGEVSASPTVRDVKTARGELVKLASVELKDSTGKVALLAWRAHADVAGQLKLADRVAVRDVYVKRGFGDHLELSTRESTTIETLSHEGEAK